MSNSDEHWIEFTELAEVVTGFILSVFNIIMSKAYNLRLHQMKTSSKPKMFWTQANFYIFVLSLFNVNVCLCLKNKTTKYESDCYQSFVL